MVIRNIVTSMYSRIHNREGYEDTSSYYQLNFQVAACTGQFCDGQTRLVLGHSFIIPTHDSYKTFRHLYVHNRTSYRSQSDIKTHQIKTINAVQPERTTPSNSRFLSITGNSQFAAMKCTLIYHDTKMNILCYHHIILNSADLKMSVPEISQTE